MFCSSFVMLYYQLYVKNAFLFHLSLHRKIPIFCMHHWPERRKFPAVNTCSYTHYDEFVMPKLDRFSFGGSRYIGQQGLSNLLLLAIRQVSGQFMSSAKTALQYAQNTWNSSASQTLDHRSHLARFVASSSYATQYASTVSNSLPPFVCTAEFR